jgi:two-component system chemotaxis response regulator CheB
VLIVLHISESFGLSFAEWLEGQIGRRVHCARAGDPLGEFAGCVIMAPCSRHLELRGGELHLSGAPPRHGCRPSIDVLFESLARECGATVAAALLTGMGRDGAAGLLEIRRAGGFTLAQDEASSVVYGMPREAARLGAAERVLPLREIGPALGLRLESPLEAALR